MWAVLVLMLAFVAIGLISAVAPVLPWLLRGGITRHCLTESCLPNPSGPPVAWSRLFATAQEYIAKVDDGAVLNDVSASAVASRSQGWDYTQALYVDFRYIGTSGDDLTLRLPDTEPTSVLLIRWQANHEAWFVASVAAEHDALVQKLSTIEVGPRQAGELTWQDALGLESTRNISPLILFHMGETTPVWGVTYRDSDDKEAMLWDLRYEVDPYTGTMTRAEPVSLPVTLPGSSDP